MAAAPLTTGELRYVEQRIAESRKSVLIAYLCWMLLAPIGGHNFMWAWATGRAAGLGAAAKGCFHRRPPGP